MDHYLRQRPAPGYDCLAFAADVWREITGEDLRVRLDGLFVPAAEREPALRHFRAFERLETPSDPCLVLMRRPRAGPHMGVFLRGRVLHLQPRGAQYVPLEIAAFGFSRVEFYR